MRHSNLNSSVQSCVRLQSSSARRVGAVSTLPGCVTVTLTAVMAVTRLTVPPLPPSLSVTSTCGSAPLQTVFLLTRSVTAPRTVRMVLTRLTVLNLISPVISPTMFSALTPAVFLSQISVTESRTAKTLRMKLTVISTNVMKTTVGVTRSVSTLHRAGGVTVLLATS